MNLRGNMILTYLSVSFFIVLIAGIGKFSIHQLMKTDQWVGHTQEILRQAHKLERVIIDMETGVRGYVLTEDRVFLEPYEAGLESYPKILSKIQEATRYDIIQEATRYDIQIGNIQEVRRRTEHWVRTIGLPLNNLPNDQARALVASGEGKRQMDGIRETIGKFNQVEEDLLSEYQMTANYTSIMASRFLLVSGIFAFILASGFSYFITKSVLKQVGGEPAEIAAFTREIATGNFGIHINPPYTGIFASVVDMMHSLRENQQQIRTQNEQLQTINDSLEEKVQQRTSELKKSNEELEQFAYIASHDLKAPLRAIANLSAWIEEEIENPNEEVKEYVRLMKSRVYRLEDLINGILEFSRVGRVNVEKTLIDLGEVIREVGETTIPENFELRIADIPKIHANKIRMIQVFENLISNAVKHHDKKSGLIEITYEETSDSHIVRVIDDGPGIDLKYHEKIFQIFQTLKSKDEVESTGIGLTIVKKIMDEHNGDVRIKSNGRGCTFILAFNKGDA